MAKPKHDPNEPITRSMIDEAIDAILEGVGSMFKNLQGRADGMDKRFDGMDRRFDKIDGNITKLESGQGHLAEKIKDLRADLSDTPSRREFQQLKSKVDRHHPGPG